MKTKSFNEILLRRRNLINVKSQLSEEDNATRVCIILKDIESLGYTFSKELIEKMIKMSCIELDLIYKELISCLESYAGADKTFDPMYINFPQCMMDDSISDFELYLNAIMHYISGGELYASGEKYEKDKRLPLFESLELTVIGLGTDEDIHEVMNNLISSKTSLSDQDKEDLIWILINNGINVDQLPDTIPFKENKAVVCSIVKENANPLEVFDFLNKYMNTATDILRWLVFESDGDVSLATSCKFKSFSRKERDLIMHLLNECGSSLEEDMKRYKNVWIRVGERIHSGEERYAKYSKAQSAFYKLRNNVKIETFNGKLEYAIDTHNITSALNLIKNRPGEFARKLDELLRKFNDDNATIIHYNDTIISCFEEVADNVSVPVLLQVREHFEHRSEMNDSRVFFPKGSLAKVYTIENKLDNINPITCQKIVNICSNAIIKQFSNKESLGKVYIDDSIKGYCVPQSQRSASKSLKPVTRGSVLPINNDANYVRGFIWWTNIDESDDIWGRSRVDIDLSAAILDENFGYLSHVSYTNLRDRTFRVYHSGDITNGGSVNGNGVSEFIDIDIDSIANNGGRYVIFQVCNYTGHKYSDMPHAMFGWMEREDCRSGEIFEPSTVEQRIDLTSESTVAIPVLFDCVTREFIWLDVAANINGMNRSCANLEGNLRGVSAMCYGIVNGNKPQMYDLAILNAVSRGEIVSDRNDADTIFDMNTKKPVQTITKTIEVQNEKGEVIDSRTEIEEVIKDCRIITPYDIDVWMGEML